MQLRLVGEAGEEARNGRSLWPGSIRWVEPEGGPRIGRGLGSGGRGCGRAGDWTIPGGRGQGRACPRTSEKACAACGLSTRLLAPTPTPGLACNASFDMYVCWDYAAPNDTARASCPWYLPWHRHGEVPPGPRALPQHKWLLTLLQTPLPRSSPTLDLLLLSVRLGVSSCLTKAGSVT